jgi:hypothetical protein
MNLRYTLTEYIQGAMETAAFDKRDDGTVGARIPVCKGLFAIGSNIEDAKKHLRSNFEDWIIVGLKLGLEMPVINGIDLNNEVQN